MRQRSNAASTPVPDAEVRPRNQWGRRPSSVHEAAAAAQVAEGHVAASAVQAVVSARLPQEAPVPASALPRAGLVEAEPAVPLRPQLTELRRGRAQRRSRRGTQGQARRLGHA